MKRSFTARGLMTGFLVAFITFLAACGSSTTSGTTDSGPPVEITWWVINNDFAPQAALFNQTHPHIHVTTQKQATADYTPKLLTAIKAGNAPDSANVEYSYLPQVEGSGGLVDLAALGAASLKSQYLPWTWNQVSQGNAIYGLPGDVGPMGLYYNKAIFDQYGIAVPTTWDEYAAAAVKLHTANPQIYIANFAPKSTSWWWGMIWQAGSRPFAINGDSWKVALNDPAAKKVAQFWQNLIDQGVVKVESNYTSDWYQELTNGTIATWSAGAFAQAFFTSSAPNASGKWRIAPIPQWSTAQPSVGNWGGSVGVVTKSSKHPREAYEWVKWLESQLEGVSLTVTNYGFVPASLAGQTFATATTPQTAAYFGNQPGITQLFVTSSQQIDGSFRWGPTMADTAADLADLFSQVATGLKLPDALDQLNTRTIAKLKQQGFNVSS